MNKQTLIAHKKLLALALPLILANITAPLLGLVDTAVLGHMASASHLAGASIGTLILTQLYWVCGFLRMSVTGQSAQAKGISTETAKAKVLVQGLLIGLCLGGLILVFQMPILHVGLILTSPNLDMQLHAVNYFDVRVWGAPAAIANYALIGWLVGQQKMKIVMWVQIIGNLLNGVADIFFVYIFELGVEGVAFASVIAEYVMCLISLFAALKLTRAAGFSFSWLNRTDLLNTLNLNGNILIRNLLLQACLAFVTIQGARLGEINTAINAILMQFFVLIALGLDGIANATEALVGEASAFKCKAKLKTVSLRGLFWSSFVAVLYSLIFYIFGKNIIALLTDIESIQLAAHEYLFIIIIMPLVAHWCFLFDGVFVGLTNAKAMRDSMLISALFVFFPVWYLFSIQGNIALWYAMLSFLLARGLTLGLVFLKITSSKNAAI